MQPTDCGNADLGASSSVKHPRQRSKEMPMTTRLVLASIFFAWGAGTLASAGPSPATPAAAPDGQEVTGQVKDSTGAVIVGASVTLRRASGDYSRETTT